MSSRPVGKEKQPSHLQQWQAKEICIVSLDCAAFVNSFLGKIFQKFSQMTETVTSFCWSSCFSPRLWHLGMGISEKLGNQPLACCSSSGTGRHELCRCGHLSDSTSWCWNEGAASATWFESALVCLLLRCTGTAGWRVRVPPPAELRQPPLAAGSARLCALPSCPPGTC